MIGVLWRAMRCHSLGWSIPRRLPGTLVCALPTFYAPRLNGSRLTILPAALVIDRRA
ncbi:hypothetical protein KCP74_12725 [Salmonella enterica subsp. enterica]|nr:hypothetical protein KCP74_12725 [Salmonella enterica subsp. enterica]